MNIKYIERTTSTNDLIREENQNLSLIWSDEQTKGRGQRGNHWESEKGKNLTFSVMIHPDFMPADQQFILSKAVSLAIVDTLCNYDITATIKWPNDIYVNDKKICGILIECSVSGSGKLSEVVIGVGLNVNQTQFLSDAPNPTSMKIEMGKEFNREEILDLFSHHFENDYLMLLEELYSAINNRYRSTLYRKDGYHSYRDSKGEFKAKISGISRYGALLLTDKNEQQREYQFKEVVFL